jgi:acyl-CoA dehydrogenase
VEAIERRLHSQVKAHEIPRMPQALPHLPGWADDALAKGLISESERLTIREFVKYADQVIQVDDFPADFDTAAGVARKDAYRRRLHDADLPRQAAE